MASRLLTGEEVGQFHSSGLLALVNETFFWPLGLALAVRREDGVYQPELWLLAADPPERIEDPDPEWRARAEVEYARRVGVLAESGHTIA